jgi:hypothetical protein
MIMPLTAQRITNWQHILHGITGLQFLSDHIIIPSWAKNAISDGSMLSVIYNPNNPNGSAMVKMIADAGLEQLAMEILFEVSFGEDDISAVLDNTILLDEIFNIPSFRGIMFYNTLFVSSLFGHANARARLIANTAALDDLIVGSEDRNAILFSSPMFVSALVNNREILDQYVALRGANTLIRGVRRSRIINFVETFTSSGTDRSIMFNMNNRGRILLLQGQNIHPITGAQSSASTTGSVRSGNIEGENIYPSSNNWSFTALSLVDATNPIVSGTVNVSGTGNLYFTFIPIT